MLGRLAAWDFTLLWLHFPEPPAVVAVKEDDDEYRLVRDLFNGYNKNVRPTKEKDLPVEVKFGIAYTQIVDLVGIFIKRLGSPYWFSFQITLMMCLKTLQVMRSQTESGSWCK